MIIKLFLFLHIKKNIIMKRFISLLVIVLMALTFISCKSEPEKIVDKYYKAMQDKDYPTAIKTALGDPIIDGDRELTAEESEEIVNALADKLASALENTTITDYKIEGCEMSESKDTAVVKVTFTTESDGVAKTDVEEVELAKDEKGIWRMGI